MRPEAGQPREAASFSKAFDNLANDPDDVVGLTARTSFVPTMFMNLAGWAVTLILTFLILVLATRADLPSFFADKVGVPGTPANKLPPPPLRSP